MKEYTDTEIGKLVDEAPELLNTLKEIAAALNDNPDVIKNILIDLDKKVDKIIKNEQEDCIMGKNPMNNLSYGLFVLTARDGLKDNGCIINTAMQVT